MSENLVKVLEVEEEYSPYFKPRIHKINVSLPYDEDMRPAKGEIAFFNVYSITRQFGGHEEGGWYYDWTHLEYTIPFLYTDDALKLLIESQENRIKDLVGGDISSVNGGQDAWVCIEKTAGESASEERPQYC